ncbi:MAG: iron-sulfur cluster repair di-iron protein [Acidobacteria bacterium]|nr:iron-sulfur cluster repair di-iron protein [Acidobacteriota bacterium]
MTQPTVKEIASQSLQAVRVFGQFGIDYCCGGKRPLADVCEDKGIPLGDVETALRSALDATAPTPEDWHQSSLCSLVDHIVRTHHEYLKRELPLITPRLEKVYRVYNQRHGPTLQGLPEVYAALRAELELHLRKEEMILFPAIVAAETAALSGLPLPRPPFGSFANPIGMMESEHDSANAALAAIREITCGFMVPDYACVTYRALYAALQQLEADLSEHIHLENDILFPRALQLARL